MACSLIKAAQAVRRYLRFRLTISNFSQILRLTLLVIPTVAGLAAPMALANPIKRQKVELNPVAFARLTETTILHKLETSVTNDVCDSALSAKQCIQFLNENHAGKTPLLHTSVSLDVLNTAFNQIDSVLKTVVDERTERPLWLVLRTLVIQARATISEKARSLTQASRQIPPNVANLFRKHGIPQVELRHRVVIAANRILVETTALAGEKILIPVTVRNLVDTTTSLEAAIDQSMRDLEKYAQSR